MVRRLLFSWILAQALLPTVVAQSASNADADTDSFHALIRETQQYTREPGYFGFVWWTPVEYWERSAERSGMSMEKAGDRYAPLRKYTMILAGVGKIGIGNINWISEPELRSNLRLRDAAGNDYEPVQELSGDAKGLAAMFKPMMANLLGSMGQNLQIYFFPGADKMAKPIADPLARGSFSVVISNILGPKESIYEWKLPLTSLSPPRYCPVGKERVEANWKYCPWHGVKLDEPVAIPVSAENAAKSSENAPAAKASNAYGLGTGAHGGKMGNIQILSDTQGVDFGSYLQLVSHNVRENWFKAIPESAQLKKGKLTIEFAVTKDGKVRGMKLVASSGDVPLDRAAWAGVTSSDPLPPLPSDFKGEYLALRFRFYYNPDKKDLE
jgi:TonB family protein